MGYPINHVHIRSRAPHESAKWYEEHFGAEIVSEGQVLPDTITIQLRLEGNVGLNISSEHEGRTLPTSTVDWHLGLEHFGFDVEDLAGELDRLEKEGVRITYPLTPVLGGRAKLAYIEAPDDVLIELVERPKSG
jgi:catechol 2,3-dioxygenase-like lactoylglutathione lyase family enzyme